MLDCYPGPLTSIKLNRVRKRKVPELAETVMELCGYVIVGYLSTVLLGIFPRRVVRPSYRLLQVRHTPEIEGVSIGLGLGIGQVGKSRNHITCV